MATAVSNQRAETVGGSVAGMRALRPGIATADEGIRSAGLVPAFLRGIDLLFQFPPAAVAVLYANCAERLRIDAVIRGKELLSCLSLFVSVRRPRFRS